MRTCHFSVHVEALASQAQHKQKGKYDLMISYLVMHVNDHRRISDGFVLHVCGVAIDLLGPSTRPWSRTA